MLTENGKCGVTGRLGTLIKSNNPMVPSVNLEYIEEMLDLRNLEHADYFCRTFNFPFNPSKWIESIMSGENIILFYLKSYVISFEDVMYESSTKDVWRQANIEWEKTLEHTELLRQIEPIKEDFIKRGRITWGDSFTFEDLVKLENQYKSTVEMFDISNPIQLDSVKKSVITSLMIDKILTGEGDMSQLKDLTGTHSQLVKMAKIDEMIESSQSEVIRTVADLAAYIEEKGFQLDFYDGVERDVVDRTIENLKEYNRTLVTESTGLDATLEAIASKYAQGEKLASDELAAETMPLEELAKEAREEMDQEIDDLITDDSILDDTDFYGEDDDDF